MKHANITWLPKVQSHIQCADTWKLCEYINITGTKIKVTIKIEIKNLNYAKQLAKKHSFISKKNEWVPFGNIPGIWSSKRDNKKHRTK